MLGPPDAFTGPDQILASRVIDGRVKWCISEGGDLQGVCLRLCTPAARDPRIPVSECKFPQEVDQRLPTSSVHCLGHPRW